MKKPLFASLIVLVTIALFLTSCVSVPLPQLKIPERKQEFNTTLALGTDGLGISLAYTPNARWVLQSSGNIKKSPAVRGCLSGEGGLGWVNLKKDIMLSATYGKGHFILEPSLSGSSDALNNAEGDFEKISLSLNHAFNHKVGLVGRVSHSWISSFFEYNRPDFNFAENFRVRFGVEAILYFSMTKKRNLLLAIGGAGSFFSTASNTAMENILYPQFFYASVGYVIDFSNP